jgi:hypothetical protein
MSQSHVDTYNADDVQAYVNRFADPYVWLELDVVPDDYNDFVAILFTSLIKSPLCANETAVHCCGEEPFTRALTEYQNL